MLDDEGCLHPFDCGCRVCQLIRRRISPCPGEVEWEAVVAFVRRHELLSDNPWGEWEDITPDPEDSEPDRGPITDEEYEEFSRRLGLQ